MDNNRHKFNRIESLQVLRGIAFLAIFSAHAGLTRLGPFGVSVFFVLSGFVSEYSIGRNVQEHKISLKKSFMFMFRRIKKLYPLHFIMLMSAIPLSMKTDMLLFKKISIALSNLLLIQTWIYKPEWYFSYNSVSWFLSVCVFLYLCFPIIDLLLGKINSVGRLCIFGATLIIFWAVGYYFVWRILGLIFNGAYIGLINYATYIFPLSRLLDFTCGCILGKVYLRNIENGVVTANKYISTRLLVEYSIIEVFLITILVVIQLFRGNTLSWWTESIVYLPIALSIVYSFAIKRGLITSICSRLRCLIKLGNLSGKTFLIHWVVIKYVEKNCEWGLFITVLISLVITIALAIVYDVMCRYINYYVALSRNN